MLKRLAKFGMNWKMCEGIACRILSRRVSPLINEGDTQTSGYILGFGNCISCSPIQGNMLWFTGNRCPCCDRLLRHWPRKGLRKLTIKKAQKNVTEEYREKMSTRMEIMICAKGVDGITYKQFRKIYRFEMKHKGLGKRQMAQDKRLEELFSDFILPSGL